MTCPKCQLPLTPPTITEQGVSWHAKCWFDAMFAKIAEKEKKVKK